MDYYTTDEINKKFDKETRNRIARMIWQPKPAKTVSIPILKK